MPSQINVGFLKKGKQPVSGVKSLIFTVIFLFGALYAFGQTVSATLDRTKILIGEQVTLQLKVENMSDQGSFISEWFTLPDSINHLEVVKRDSIDTVELNGSVSLLQKIILTSFDSGKWVFPRLGVVLQDKNSGKQTILQADSLALEVLPVDVSGLKNFHDIKDILAVQVKPDYRLILSILLAVIIFLALVFWWIKKRKRKVTVLVKPSRKGSLLEWTMEQIIALEKENLPEKHQVKLFYSRLDEICRNYFDELLAIGALHSTSDEIMIKLKLYISEDSGRTGFFQFLRLADAVKFAKFLPASQQHNEALKIVKNTIRETDNAIQIMKKNNAY